MTEKRVEELLGPLFGRYLKLETPPGDGENCFIMLADPDGERPMKILGKGNSWFAAMYDFCIQPDTCAKMLADYLNGRGKNAPGEH